MSYIKRVYHHLLQGHFSEGMEMAFLTGPRQVGKTTIARLFDENATYLNWDNEDHRLLILKGPSEVAEYIGLPKSRVVIFDELHKYPHWKTFLKGFYDTFTKMNFNIIVSGSARLDIYRKGGDSLMGRYFMYRVHPLTVGELVSPEIPMGEFKKPLKLADSQWLNLIQFGGFPQPFLRGNKRFYNRWKRTRFSQIFREDIHDVAMVHEIRLVEILAELIHLQAGQLISYASFARKLRVSEDSIRRWLGVLENLFYCFAVRPWYKNLNRSLRKTPKFYLWDWAMVDEAGARNENMIACHLLKATHFWTDLGLGNFGLYFLRTKEKREVDFLVSRDGIPWCLVEVKTSDASLNKNLLYFHKVLNTQYAFQVTVNDSYIDEDCFSFHHPINVPARTFLSQLP
jgi:predicted AAA+ superfamily ATPase